MKALKYFINISEEDKLLNIKLEPILTREGEIYGYEILVGDYIVFNKEKFFSSLDEILDFIIFETHIEIIRSIDILKNSLIFVNLLPSTLIKFSRKLEVPENVIIEIRENYADIEMIKKIREIKEEKGLRIALDDFGKNGSNFERFFLLKPEYVKIDIKLFSNVHHSCTRVILSRLCSLFGTAGSKVIAEKVENEEDFKNVLYSDIELWQGYFTRELIWW